MKNFLALLLLAFSLCAGAACAESPSNNATPPAKAPFRLRFQSYDGDPRIDPPNKFSFHVKTVDLKQPSEFVKLGDVISGTKLRLEKFTFKEAPNPKSGELQDVSELTLVNISTGKKIVLILDQTIDAADVR